MPKTILQRFLPVAILGVAAASMAWGQAPAVNIFQLATRPLCGFTSSFPQPIFTFNINAPEIWISADIYGITAGSGGTVSWIDPNGNTSVSRSLGFEYSGEWCIYVYLTSVLEGAPLDPAKLIPGTWTVQFSLNGTLLASQAFTITLPGGCTTISLGSSSASVPSGGGTGAVAVSTGNGCAWSVTAGPPLWLHLTGTRGSGNGTVNYSADPNTGPARSGSFGVDGQTFTVNQAGVPCTVSLQPNSANLAAAGGTGTMSVTSPAGCSWTAATMSTWLHITSGASGSGNGVVGYSADANTATASRTDTIFVSGQIFRVAEAAAGPPPPTISQGGVAEPWTYTQGIAPGAWISIVGSNLASTSTSWAPVLNAPLPTNVGGVTVSIAGILAPVSYVSPGLINALVPALVPLNQVAIIVTNNGVSSVPYQVTATEFLPAIYSTGVGGTDPPLYYVTAVDPVTGELVGKVSLNNPLVKRAAQPGESIDLYGLGLGPAATFITDTAFSGFYDVTLNFVITIDGVSITPQFAALVGPGLYQIRMTIPTSMPTGDQLLLLNFGVAQSAPNVYLSVSN